MFPAPEYIQLYPTLRCNQRCSFCFNNANTPARDMKRQEASRLLDIMQSHRISELDIMGGEPFILPWMPGFIREAAGLGIKVNVSTNGSLLQAVKQLEGISPSFLTIGISLEGSNERLHNHLTGSANFSEALGSLDWLSAAGLDPLVKTVLSRMTAGDIQGIIRLLRDRGLRRYYLIHMDLLSRKEDDSGGAIGYPEFSGLVDNIRASNPGMGIHSVTASCFSSARPRHIRCAAGTRKVAVMPDGSVFPCNLFQGLPEFQIGNIFSEGLPSIMADPRLGYFRDFSGSTCTVEGCVNSSLCTGGCPAHGYYHSGNPDGPDIRCLSLRHTCRLCGHNDP